ncbi:tubulin-tyrosine ligase family-domain-containing protein [Scheffersomyces coipomensis]|uniref:tubulin-tyrosine ligase family-domain-containing protein n=1 Tax=Scheffersomyces coipomensis TaxID=1788519 RepID=UPI00315C6186
MHVLLTNDDGPLNDNSCPYIKYLVDEINTSTNWDLSIVIPNQQRSWIGKAHFAGKTLTTSYIYTKYSTDEPNPNINSYIGPFKTPEPKYHLNRDEYQEWCLIDSTPAACADIGIHYLYKNSKSKPIDLVLSGPNFGKNSSNLYILTSGTVGAAMEASTHGIKSIALSYSFNSLDHDFKILKEAAKISVKLIEKLYQKLILNHDTIDIFSVNVPLIPSLKLGTTKIQYAPILQNSWHSIYEEDLESINEQGQLQFKWNPDFKKVYKDGLSDFNHTDSRVLLNEGISVTPLKATFRTVEPLTGEIVLDAEEGDESKDDIDTFIFLITIPSSAYIFKPLVESFQKNFPSIQITTDSSILLKINNHPHLKVFHYGEYEDLDIDLIQSHPKQYFIPSYIFRKALIRKHYLYNTIHHYVTKNPESVLKEAFPETYNLEVDYAEFLDDSLDDAYELRDEINKGEKVWILKPSMSDKGQGIRLFKTIDQLQEVFNSFEEEEEEEDDDEDEDEEGEGQVQVQDESEQDNKHDTGIILSQLRHFVVQEYKSSPLLLSNYDDKKFHLRIYVVCSGNLKVFVYKNILTLFASAKYQDPINEPEDQEIPLDGHLTNTCLQEDEEPLVVPFWSLQGLDDASKIKIFDQIKSIIGDLYKAASTIDKINFQPLDNAIELFGIDCLINDDLSVNLLEVNSYPDFKQTGDELKGIIYELFDNVVKDVVNPLVDNKSNEQQTLEDDETTLVKVLDI